MGTIQITIDGRPALTVEQAAERYELKPSSMRAAIANNKIANDGMLDGRKPLYLTERLDEVMAARPGRGAPGVPRPHKPPTGSA